MLMVAAATPAGAGAAADNTSATAAYCWAVPPLPCSDTHAALLLVVAPLPSAAPQGDNNWGDDRSLYPKGQLWLNRGHIMGKVVG